MANAARALASPSALVARTNPATRARAAVAWPTASSGRWWCVGGNEGIALPLVTRIACTRSAGGSDTPRVWTTSSGARTGRKPSNAIRSAVSLAPGSGRVTRMPRSRSIKDVAGTVSPQIVPDFAADPARIYDRALQAALQDEGPVGARDKRSNVQRTTRQYPGIRANRCATGAIQPLQHRSLRGGGSSRVGVVHGGEQVAQPAIIFSHGHADDALPGGRHHGLRIQHRICSVSEAESL